MQIGADIYCDSLCILHALQQFVPSPTLFPDDNDCWVLSAWTDGQFFRQAVAVVLGSEVDNLPPEFAADRGRLYFGRNYDLNALAAGLDHLVGQLRAHLTVMQQLLGERRFMHGEQPGLADTLCYYLVWFIQGRYRKGPRLLADFPFLQAWAKRVEAFGHGRQSEMSAEESHNIALRAHPITDPVIDVADPLRLRLGDPVGVVPEGDGGDPPVHGELVCLTSETISVRRWHERVGDVVVHFPRIGYRISAADSC